MSVIPRSIVSALLAAALAGCFGPAPEKVRIGLGSWPGGEYLTLAAELGLFAEEGVAVQLVEFDSPVDARRAFELGQLDGVTGTQIELLHLRGSGTRTPFAVYVLAASARAYALLSREASVSAADLAGKRVAIEPQSSGEFLFLQALDAGEKRLEDFTAVFLRGAEMSRAFRERTIDAAVVPPPYAVVLGRDESLKFTPLPYEETSDVLDLLMFDADFLEQRIEVIARILTALDRAMAHADEKPDRARELLGRRVGISPEEVRAVLSQSVRRFRLDEQAELMRSGGRLESALRGAYVRLVEAEELSDTKSSVPTWSRLPYKRALKLWDSR